MLSQLNSSFMYIMCGIIIAVIAGICLFFAVRAYFAGKNAGIDTVKMRKAIISSVSFSVLPSVGILIGVLALSGSLGFPWPWLRLSVIGALHYETQVAEAASEAMTGKQLSLSNMTPEIFVTIALVMSFCIIWSMVLALFHEKTYISKLSDIRVNKTSRFKSKVNLTTAMFMGLVSAYLGSYIGSFVSVPSRFSFSGSFIPVLCALVAMIVMAILTAVKERFHAGWIDNFALAVSMLMGMAVAIVFR